MAASLARTTRPLVRATKAISSTGVLRPTTCRFLNRSTLIRSPRLPPVVCFHTGPVSRCLSSTANFTVTDEPDTLYQSISVLVKGHDKAVLDSYEFFASLAAKELGITLSKVFEPPKHIERFTLLKSIHIFKKHRVQYEMRTHHRCIELARVTGSTAQVYLEYIQRNLPEGVAMEVTKTSIEKIPEHIKEPLWGDEAEKKPSSESEKA